MSFLKLTRIIVLLLIAATISVIAEESLDSNSTIVLFTIPESRIEGLPIPTIMERQALENRVIVSNSVLDRVNRTLAENLESYQSKLEWNFLHLLQRNYDRYDTWIYLSSLLLQVYTRRAIEIKTIVQPQDPVIVSQIQHLLSLCESDGIEAKFSSIEQHVALQADQIIADTSLVNNIIKSTPIIPSFGYVSLIYHSNQIFTTAKAVIDKYREMVKNKPKELIPQRILNSRYSWLRFFYEQQLPIRKAIQLDLRSELNVVEMYSQSITRLIKLLETEIESNSLILSDNNSNNND
ncbi:hypothetical protein BLOT_001228 [Blomia tropicalis]|nr:hypothetical protein BLOT_001228 [Blomia tropicalis]